MPRKLTANEIDNIMVGATFLGAGGGGPLDTGRELLEKQATGSYSIDLYSMDEIAKEERDSTYGAMSPAWGLRRKSRRMAPLARMEWLALMHSRRQCCCMTRRSSICIPARWAV